jgi:hypothetical protein
MIKDESDGMRRKEVREYLGGGLFVAFDGHDICAYTERDGETHEVFFDPTALAAFLDFIERTRQPTADEHRARVRADIDAEQQPG